eukprot:434861-Hanusia_phi.AAC.4
MQDNYLARPVCVRNEHASLNCKIEASKGVVNAESQKWLRWKAAHEKYEQAAFQNISSIENNKTGISPEGEAYFDKIGTLAQQYDGSFGYESLLNMSKELEENRTISWKHLLSVQKNRSTFFPLVDRRMAVSVSSPEQSTLRSSGGPSLADTHGLQSLPLGSSALKVGQKAVAIKSFLFSQGGMIPVKEGEAVTVLEVDDKMGVDKVLTGQGKVGWFPQTDLRAEAQADGSEVSQEPAPEAGDSNVVATAIAEGNRRYAAAREREISMSKEKRRNRAMERSKLTRKSPPTAADAEKSEDEQKQSPSVVQKAIREANDRYRSAKQQEVERSLQLEKLRKQQRALVKEIHQQEKLVDLAKQAREDDDAEQDHKQDAKNRVEAASSKAGSPNTNEDDASIVKSDDAVLAGLRKAQKSYVSAKVEEEEKSLLYRIRQSDAKKSLKKEREVERQVRDQRMKISEEEDADKHAAVAANLKRHVDEIGSAFKSEEDYFLQAHKKEIHDLAMERMRKASHMLALPRGGVVAGKTGLKAQEAKSSGTEGASRWKKEEEMELETRRAEEKAVRAADKMFSRHMKPLENVERGYENYEHELER